MAVHRLSFVRAAYDNVRASVLDGSLAPGTRVTVRPLSEQLGLSSTPIKAALAALEREGFLVSVPHRGYFVPEFGTDDLLDLYELREAVDGMAARRSAAASGRAVLATGLESLLHQQREQVGRGNLSAYGDLDLQFHRLIWEYSGNRRLLPVAENLVAQVRLGNKLSAQAPGRLPEALEEHQLILAAIRAGDPRAAERHVRSHVRQAGEALRRYLRDQPANH